MNFRNILLCTALTTVAASAGATTLSNINNGGNINTSTDKCVAVRSGTTDELVSFSSFLMPTNSSMMAGDFFDMLGTSTNHVAHFGITTDRLANYASSCTTCFYLALDKPNINGDVQTVYTDTGNIRWTAGMNGDDNFEIQQVSGSSLSSFSFTDVVDIFTSSRNVGIGTGRVDPGFLLGIGTGSPAYFDYNGNFTTSGIIYVFNPAGIAELKIRGEETSGNGSIIIMSDSTSGNIGYLGQNSAANNGTAYTQFDMQNPQTGGTICISDGGFASATAGSSCVMYLDGYGFQEFRSGVSSLVVSSGSSACGTSASIVGADNFFTVTVGSSTNGSSCPVTFANVHPLIVGCIAQNTTSVARPVYAISITSSTVSVKASGTISSGDKLTVECH